MKGKSMKNILFLFTILIAAARLQAQVDVPEHTKPKELEETVYGLGVSGGLVSGFGLSFRHHFPAEISYQLVGGIIKVDRKLSYNFGGVLQYNLMRGERVRFYACGGLGYFYSGEEKNDLTAPLRAGVGIGIEQARFEAFALSGEFMFTFFSDGSILPLPQVSAHYYFF